MNHLHGVEVSDAGDELLKQAPGKCVGGGGLNMSREVGAKARAWEVEPRGR